MALYSQSTPFSHLHTEEAGFSTSELNDLHEKPHDESLQLNNSNFVSKGKNMSVFDHGKGVQIGNQEHQCGGSIQTFPQRTALESPVLRALTLAVPSQLEFSLPRFPTHASAWNDQPSVSGAEFSRVKEVTP